MKKQGMKKSISMMLVLVMAFGLLPMDMLALTSKNTAIEDGAIAVDVLASSDPFIGMVDPPEVQIPYEQYYIGVEGNPEADGMLPDLDREIDSDEPRFVVDEEAGKTDRYIVKYKDGRQTSFEQKLAGDIESIVSFDAPALSVSSGVMSVDRMEITSRDRLVIDLPVEPEYISDTQLIVLSEKKLPSEFAQELAALGAGRDIEYIQPDYELSLDSLELQLVDENFQPIVDDGELEEEITNQEDILDTEEELAGKDIEDVELIDGGKEIKPIIDLEPLVPVIPNDSSEPVLVAIIDTGLDSGHEMFEGYLHPDTPDTETELLSYAHGTHVAGIVVGTVQDVGANVQILPIKVFNDGNAYTSDIIAAIEYATMMGAQVINCSFGSINENRALYEAIAASDALFVCAVGNNRRDFDEVPSYPAGYDLPNVISVASVNADGGFSYFSNYGSGSIDITALGRDVYSALPGNSYGIQTGTSMSAAYVTGVAASVLGQEVLTAGQLKERLISSADMLDNLENKVIAGRRVNLENALDNIEGSYLTLNPEDDFDVHGYQPTAEESWQLFNAAGDVVQVAGTEHTLAVKADGTVWAWGWNGNGELGDGTKLDRGTPRQVVGLEGVKSVAVGGTYSLALKEDGTVWGWGCNNMGALGDGTSTNRLAPVQAIGLSNVKMIAAGAGHSLALKEDGTVWAWGQNSRGELGDGTTTYRYRAVQVTGLSDVKMIVGGSTYSLALKEDGTVWAWGRGDSGQLGAGAVIGTLLPIQIMDLSRIKVVSTSYDHSLAVEEDGTVWAWGTNGSGELGDRTSTARNLPVKVAGLNNVKAVAGGRSFSLALKEDGMVWAWGNNTYGQLGDGTTVIRKIPVQVIELQNVHSVVAGYSHSLAIREDGSLWCWGGNDKGQLGDGLNAKSNTPLWGIELEAVEAIAAGSSHSLALKEDGTVWVWGKNNYGQLGDGTTVNKSTPAQIAGLSDVEMIAAGSSHSLALKEDGTVWAWGYSSYGQLGDGTVINRNAPVQITGLSNVRMIAAGSSHSMALKEDGTVWAWGSNQYGQLGDDTLTHKNMPIQTTGLSNVVKIVAGSSHSMALKEDGTVWVWGKNSYGQLGDGTTVNKSTPAQIAGLSDVEMIAAGSSHSLALKEDGTVWAWGYSSYGQLGDGTVINRNAPVQITGLSNVRMIAAGSSHSMALKEDGTVWAWGCNEDGQLGEGTWLKKLAPMQVIGIDDAISIAAGGAHNLVVQESAQMLVWGSDNFGQLGLGRIIKSTIPTKVSIKHMHIAFEQDEYLIIVSNQETRKIAVKSWVRDVKGSVLPNIVITYSLEPSYPGVSINAITGVVSVSCTAEPGTVKIKATYNGMEATAELVLKPWAVGIAEPDNIKITADVGKYVRVAVVGREMYTFRGTTITLTYDPAKLELQNIMEQLGAVHISPGVVSSAGITITQVSPGEIKLSVDKPIPAGKTWSGIITVVQFKALSTGTTTVTVS